MIEAPLYRSRARREYNLYSPRREYSWCAVTHEALF